MPTPFKPHVWGLEVEIKLFLWCNCDCEWFHSACNWMKWVVIWSQGLLKLLESSWQYCPLIMRLLACFGLCANYFILPGISWTSDALVSYWVSIRKDIIWAGKPLGALPMYTLQISGKWLFWIHTKIEEQVPRLVTLHLPLVVSQSTPDSTWRHPSSAQNHKGGA